MEYYESRCVVCGHRWSWIGYKTAMGKTPAQIAQMKDAGKTCPVCGGIAKVGLDHESPDARALDGAMRDVVGDVLGKKVVHAGDAEAPSADVLESWEKTRHEEGRREGHEIPPPRVRVETVKPDVEASDWMPEALAARRWGVTGLVVGHHDSHGLVYEVEHDDGTRACYERRELEIVVGIPMFDVLDWMLAPLSAVSSEPPSPKVAFQVGQTVHIHKFGWNGADRIAEIRGEHVRVEGMIKMFDEERPLWFHYTELRSS